jgi:hypothetical protein
MAFLTASPGGMGILGQVEKEKLLLRMFEKVRRSFVVTCKPKGRAITLVASSIGVHPGKRPGGEIWQTVYGTMQDKEVCGVGELMVDTKNVTRL